jgi:hypothetical protein
VAVAYTERPALCLTTDGDPGSGQVPDRASRSRLGALGEGIGVPAYPHVTSLEGPLKRRGKVLRAGVLRGSRYPCKLGARGLTLAGVIGDLGQVGFRNFSARRHGHG